MLTSCRESGRIGRCLRATLPKKTVPTGMEDDSSRVLGTLSSRSTVLYGWTKSIISPLAVETAIA